MHISDLFLYPVKSGAAVRVGFCDLDERGMAGDREYMVVDEAGGFLTQREAPLLALLRWEAPYLVTPHGRAQVWPGLHREVTVWDYTGPALDCGDEAARLVSELLGRLCRVVRTGADHDRLSDDGRSGVGFADGYPLLLIGQASLQALNDRLPQPIPMDRFRPNIVVAGASPFAEDQWARIRIGDVLAEVVKPCIRCAITRVDQATGLRGDGEPLRTLGQFRKVKGGVIFGQNVVHDSIGTIHVGDEVEVLSRQAAPTARS